MHSLQGVGVLVTRPEAQADSLCKLLQERGALVSRLPALDIIAFGDLAALARRIGPIGKFDVVIFTSVNAVRFGSALLQNAAPDIELAAIGPATARALQLAGHRVTIEPQGGFDSEALLEDRRLAAPRNARVVIVKGVGGRDTLRAELTQRGANVQCADVYERRLIRPSDAQMEALARSIADGKIRIVTATSLDIAAHLLDAATPALRALYQQVHWLVPSVRIADGMRERGCTAPLIRAASADDRHLVLALETWHAEQHGG